jgi:hypothetical protein
MGFQLHVCRKTFRCSYDGWNDIRNNILNLTFKYLEDLFIKDAELYKDLKEDDEKWIGEGSSYHFHKEKINSIIKYFKKYNIQNINDYNEYNNLTNFIDICNKEFYYIDALIYFNVGGLFTLCYKMDSEGHYSPGNSLDICELFDLIEETVKNSELPNLYETIYSKYNNSFSVRLYDIFNESFTKKIPAKIC